MNAITDVWRQLVRRRLWPVALLLVAALAAVPMLLAKEPEPAPSVPPASGTATTATSALASEPIVALGESLEPGTDRAPLGDRHDIFKPTKKPPKVKPAKDEPQPEKPAEEKPAGGDTGSKDGGGSTPTAPVAPVAPEAKPEPKTYPLYSLKVRFSVGETAEKGYLPRLSALPSRAEPMIVYLGLLDDRKTAVFLLDSTLQAVGDGECHPTPDNCETVRMRVGDTMFFDVVGADGQVAGEQFQLDLLDINKKPTTDAAKSAKSARLAKVAAANGLKAEVTAGLGRETVRRLGVVGRTG